MSIETMQTLSSTLRGRRHALGLTQSALAAQAGVSRKFISDAESGKDTIEVGRLLKLIAALDLRLDLRLHATSPSTSAAPAIDLDAILGDYLGSDG
jgi:HTH-type transcriptional regulator/antitoxin HipB